MRELEINLTIKHVYARKKKELKRSGRNGNVEYGEARKEGDDCCKQFVGREGGSHSNRGSIMLSDGFE